MTDTGAQLAVNHSLIASTVNSRGAGLNTGLPNHITQSYITESGTNTMNNLGSSHIYLLSQDHPQVQTSHCVNPMTVVQEGAVARTPGVQDHVNNQQVDFGASKMGTQIPGEMREVVQSNPNDPSTLQGATEYPTPDEESREIEETEGNDSQPSIDIVINNVVSSFSTRCHLNLKKIALEGCNVMYRRESGVSTCRCKSSALLTPIIIWLF